MFENVGRASDMLERASRLHLLLIASYNRILPYLDGKTFREATERSEAAIARSNKVFREIRRRDRDSLETQIIGRVSLAWSPEEKAAYDALSDDEKDAWWERTINEELGPPEDDEVDE